MNYYSSKEYIEDKVLELYDYYCNDFAKTGITSTGSTLKYEYEWGYYFVSIAYNDGYDVWVIDVEDVDVFIIKDGKILEQYIETKAGPQGYNGYKKVFVPGKGEATVHRLVCYAFKQWDKWDHNLVVDHIDRNKLNNHYKNLRLVSQSVNMLNRDFIKEVGK